MNREAGQEVDIEGKPLFENDQDAGVASMGFTQNLKNIYSTVESQFLTK